MFVCFEVYLSCWYQVCIDLYRISSFCVTEGTKPSKASSKSASDITVFVSSTSIPGENIIVINMRSNTNTNRISAKTRNKFWLKHCLLDLLLNCLKMLNTNYHHNIYIYIIKIIDSMRGVTGTFGLIFSIQLKKNMPHIEL